MPLKDRLQEDWKQALKAKDKFRADTISSARAAILQVEKNQGAASVDDDTIIEILAKEVKQRREAIIEFEKGNRQDLVDKANAEIEILLSYLPQQLSEDEIYEIVRVTATEVGANSMKDMGRLMSAVMERVKGRAEGKVVSTIVKEHLSK
ncbi:glutamyl-tRNA(Gln) amidotransferase subunit E [Clostridium sp. N3C]|uniref:GatB/YqeY domain-containing protein n=1 Tax=Clostridium sp. N3C TaxID=1776758 RepID=UPI00092E0AEE|nr:GatB/YqeY domain-containing protein [Clostridium sp. N3C]SCN21782.1 glutamyl-tRNA(Gln) amidotransferase subunit E [Clostridium sp. N3C]